VQEKTFRPRALHAINVERKGTTLGIAGHQNGTDALATRLLAEGRLHPAQCRGIPPFQASPAENKFGVPIARNSTLKESVLPNRKVQRFLIASGSNLSLINPGVTLAEFKPIDLATRGIIGIKFKSIGTVEVDMKLVQRRYTLIFGDCPTLLL
jgi:hypothetical protein